MRNTTSARHRQGIVVLTILTSSFFAVLAEGFRNPAPGSFGLARSGGRVAQIDDASAVTHNPANLVDLGESEFLFSPMLVHIQSEFNLQAGGRARTEDPWKLLPSLYFATPLPNKRMAAGIGVTSPYGLSNEWEDSGAFSIGHPSLLRYNQPYYSELKTIQINPSFAYRINDQLSLGLGVDVMWSQFTLRQHYPWAPWGGAGEGSMEMEGDGWGAGANVGITWEPFEGHRLALAIRTPLHVKHKGDFQINNVAATARLFGVSERSDFRTDIKFPTIIHAGYGVQIGSDLKVEADIEWLEFSNFDRLDLHTGSNSPLFPTGTSFPQNWKNTYTAGFSMDWNFLNEWHLMGGYHFFESPVPVSSLSTVIPDASQNAITMGVMWRMPRHRIGMAYSSVFYRDRTVTSNPNPVLNGTYESHVHLLSLNYSYAF